jgi:hypothetical protein
LGEASLYDGEPAPEQVPTELLPTLYVLPQGAAGFSYKGVTGLDLSNAKKARF